MWFRLRTEAGIIPRRPRVIVRAHMRADNAWALDITDAAVSCARRAASSPSSYAVVVDRLDARTPALRDVPIGRCCQCEADRARMHLDRSERPSNRTRSPPSAGRRAPASRASRRLSLRGLDL